LELTADIPTPDLGVYLPFKPEEEEEEEEEEDQWLKVYYVHQLIRRS
jgi:hypothetical protein